VTIETIQQKKIQELQTFVLYILLVFYIWMRGLNILSDTVGNTGGASTMVTTIRDEKF